MARMRRGGDQLPPIGGRFQAAEERQNRPEPTSPQQNSGDIEMSDRSHSNTRKQRMPHFQESDKSSGDDY